MSKCHQRPSSTVSVTLMSAMVVGIEAPTVIDLTAPGNTDATKATYAAAFDAVLPRAVRVANDARVAAARPKP
jgi:hypothetical protein